MTHRRTEKRLEISSVATGEKEKGMPSSNSKVEQLGNLMPRHAKPSCNDHEITKS
jgi:hypothetical protein